MQTKNKSRFQLTAATLAAVCFVAACGGSGGDDDDDNAGALSSEVAEGYVADSAAMPVVAADGVDLAVETLEAGLAAGALGSGQVRAQSVDGSMACAGGGTVSWTVVGADAGNEGNGRLDAGEVVDVDYAACIGADGTTTLDGSMQLTVTARDDSSSDLALLVSGLKVSKPAGSFTVGGGVRVQRQTTALDGGGSRRERELSGEAVVLVASIGGRESNYRLNSYDWTVVKTYDAGGALTGRTHDGQLTLQSDTPRRPDAQIEIESDGALTIGSDGYVAAGRFVATTTNDELTATWADGSVTLTLDLGKDGSIDRTWTVTRDQLKAQLG
ncbi:hypothetical protein [Rubrivivax gelatinosus]|uniref:hypothetical protein n=1 Tax=Rubrivivax gelatinosus TaxID=28068 RepID=UPI00190503AC|nr:hypothetical protein [Rubrivivax gelatinosus]